MTEKVPMMDIGNERMGSTVADRFRKKRKTTMITRHKVRTRVNLTSLTDSRIDSERSYKMLSSAEAGICSLNSGSKRRTASATATVLVPGCLETARTTDRFA